MVLISFNEVRRTMIYPLLLMFFSIYSSFVLKKSGSIFGEMDMSSIPDSEKENYSSIMTLYYMIIITTLMYLSESCILILYYIQKRNTVRKDDSGMGFLHGKTKTKIKIILIIVILFVVDCTSSFATVYLIGAGIVGFCEMILKGIVLIAATVLSMIILNYKYYKHHWVGCIIIFIGLIIFTCNDFLVNWAKIKTLENSILSIIITVFIGYIWSAFQEVLEKYLMDKMYISPFVVMGLEGIGGLIMMTVGLSILCILPISDTLSFHNYAIFIGHAFGDCSAMLPYFGLLSFGLFGFNTFKVLTNHYYFPTYKGLSDVIGNFIRWILFSSIGLVKNDNESDYYIIKVISYVILTIGVII